MLWVVSCWGTDGRVEVVDEEELEEGVYWGEFEQVNVEVSLDGDGC